jgi:nucleotide sugar dehydrogenase
MQKVSVIGIGKLGLCFALTLERAGYDVLGVDIFPDYVSAVNDRTLQSDEHNVEEYLQECTNLRATVDLQEAVEFSDYLYVVVATPSLPSGRYDHSQVDSVIEKLQALGPVQQKHFIVCCTTMPGYCDTAYERLKDLGYTVSYNPEFIAQGTILRDQAYPDTVLIGESDETVGSAIQEMYEKMTDSSPSFHRMARTEAEICKISLNCFLTTKIAFANMVGDIANYSGVRPAPILKAIGSDTRIGQKYLGYGYGYGGPCFPRDNRALALFAGDVGIEALISKASDESNKQHLDYQVSLFKLKNDVKEPVEFDYVTYKPESTMLVESQQLLFAQRLAEEGYEVILNERTSVIDEIKKIHGDLFTYKERKE